MTYEEAVKKLKSTCDELREIINTLKEKESKEKSRWKPENKQEYWFVNSFGEVKGDIWCDVDRDKDRYKRGNCYRTKEECEFAAECELVEQELKDYADEHNEGEIVWDDGSKKFHLIYDHHEWEIGILCCSKFQRKDIYFTSEEIARCAIETIGEERLIKYYFKVEE